MNRKRIGIVASFFALALIFGLVGRSEANVVGQFVRRAGDYMSGTLRSLVATGTNAISIINAGARLDLGPGASDYWYSDPTFNNVTTPGIVDIQSGQLFLSGGTTDIYSNVNAGSLKSHAGSGAPTAVHEFMNAATTQVARVAINSAGTGGGFFVQPPQTATIADNGGGTNATLTLTPTSNNIQLTCNDAQGCDITMAETGMENGFVVCIQSMTGAAGAGENNFADTDGVSNLTAAFAAETDDRICMTYDADEWTEISRANN